MQSGESGCKSSAGHGGQKQEATQPRFGVTEDVISPGRHEADAVGGSGAGKRVLARGEASACKELGDAADLDSSEDIGKGDLQAFQNFGLNPEGSMELLNGLSAVTSMVKLVF